MQNEANFRQDQMRQTNPICLRRARKTIAKAGGLDDATRQGTNVQNEANFRRGRMGRDLGDAGRNSGFVKRLRWRSSCRPFGVPRLRGSDWSFPPEGGTGLPNAELCVWGPTPNRRAAQPPYAPRFYRRSPLGPPTFCENSLASNAADG